jgi:hypothetical protein
MLCQRARPGLNAPVQRAMVGKPVGTGYKLKEIYNWIRYLDTSGERLARTLNSGALSTAAGVHTELMRRRLQITPAAGYVERDLVVL